VKSEQRARARSAIGLGENEVGVLFVGQLEERKDPLGAISAVEAARREGSELVLLIAGGGPLEQQVAARAGAAARPLGFRDDLTDLYAAADLFLLPSHREGMSFALLEAMARGLAPVVADGTGNVETVGAAGIVFPAGDLGAMSARIGELAANPDARSGRPKGPGRGACAARVLAASAGRRRAPAAIGRRRLEGFRGSAGHGAESRSPPPAAPARRGRRRCRRP